MGSTRCEGNDLSWKEKKGTTRSGDRADFHRVILHAVGNHGATHTFSCTRLKVVMKVLGVRLDVGCTVHDPRRLRQPMLD